MYTFVCFKDTIVDKELAFRRGFYYCGNKHIIYGNNNKPYNIEVLESKVGKLPCFLYLYNPNQCDNAYMGAEDNNKIEYDDRVNHPAHYNYLKKLCGIEVIDITRHMNFNLGNVIKYVLRAGHKFEQGMNKNQKRIEDLKKAAFYLNDEIKRLEIGNKD